MTLTDKKIERMVNQYQYIASVVGDHTIEKSIEERMTQLYFFLRDNMEDVEREDRQAAIEKRNRLNGYPSKAGH